MPTDHPISRRRFLTGAATGAALAVTSCGSAPESTSQSAYSTAEPIKPPHDAMGMPNPLDVFRQYEIMDQNGNPLNHFALRQVLRDQHFTVSFGFNGCAAYCPFTNTAFAQLDRANPGRVKHIVINTIPETDGMTQEHREKYRASITAQGVNLRDVIILYPRSAKKTMELAQDLGSRVRLDDPTQHSGKIVLYTGTGQSLVQSDSAHMLEDVPGFTSLMAAKAPQR